MPLKEKNRTKTKIAPPGAFSVASPCTFCSLQAAQPGGSSLSSTPCPGPRRGGVPSPCLGGTTNAQQAPTLPSLSPPSPAPVPLQFLDLHTCLDSGSADFFPAAVSAQRKQNPPPGRGVFISSTRGQCSCKGGLCAPRGARWPPKANHSPGCLQTSSFTRGPPSPCP